MPPNPIPPMFAAVVDLSDAAAVDRARKAIRRGYDGSVPDLLPTAPGSGFYALIDAGSWGISSAFCPDAEGLARMLLPLVDLGDVRLGLFSSFEVADQVRAAMEG